MIVSSMWHLLRVVVVHMIDYTLLIKVLYAKIRILSFKIGANFSPPILL